MSKMSQLHAELSEQACELGFEDLNDALAHGYELDTEAMANGIARLCIDREQENAHDDYLKRKEGILLDLETLKNNINTTIDRVIDFIKEGEV